MGLALTCYLAQPCCLGSRDVYSHQHCCLRATGLFCCSKMKQDSRTRRWCHVFELEACLACRALPRVLAGPEQEFMDCSSDVRRGTFIRLHLYTTTNRSVIPWQLWKDKAPARGWGSCPELGLDSSAARLAAPAACANTQSTGQAAASTQRIILRIAVQSV